MSMKNILTKIPCKSPAFWLCLGFTALYLMLGWRMADTLVYDYNGLLFQTDTVEVAEDITEFQTRNHGDTNVHPLFVLFVNPLGVFLSSFLPTTIAVIVINTLFGTLIIWAAYSCFIQMGLPLYQSALWTILTGCTATNLLFVSIPERHIMASFSITLLCLFCVKYPARVGKFVWVGLITFGITITNFLQCGILFFASLFNDNDRPENTFKFVVQKTIKFGLITLSIAVVLSLIQKWIWPDTRYFFIPNVFVEETAFFRITRTPAQTLNELAELGAHLFVFNIAAPLSIIDLDGKFTPLTLSIKSLSSLGPIGLMALAGWSLVLLLSFNLIFFRRHNKWFWLQMGIIACLLFNSIMHMIYGDDFFLYTVNWTFLIIALTASSAVSANKSSAFRLTLNTLMTFMVSAVVLNNAIFINDITSYFKYGSSMKWQMNHGSQWELAKVMERFLVKEQIHTVFSGDKQKWLSTATNHRIKIVNIPNERSISLKQNAELISDNYAFLYDIGDVITFITNSMGSYSKRSFDDFDFYYNIIPPLQDLSPVSRKEVTEISASCNTNNASAVADLNLDTRWKGENKPDAQDWIAFTFSEPRQVSCVRILERNGDYPLQWQIEVRETSTSDWQAVTSNMNCEGYFWSGPRIFWNGKQYHQDARFLPMIISQIRLVFPPNNEGRNASLSEVLIYGPGDPIASEVTALPLLLDELREKNIKKLYSERWVANAVYRRTAILRDTPRMYVETLLEPYVFEQKRARAQPVLDRTPYPVYLSNDAGILTRLENAETTRACLNKRGYSMRETTIGPWILFDFRDSEWSETYAGYAKLYWGSISCFLAEPNGTSKKKALELTSMALHAKDPDQKASILTDALSFYPDSQDTLRHLEQILRNQNKTDEADSIKQRLLLLQTPEIKTPIQFGKNISMTGLSVDTLPATPGGEIKIRYFWKYKPGRDNHNRYSVFVHFQHENKTVFQGDHDFCWQYSNDELRCQGENEIFSEQLVHSIPANAPAGDYRIIIGVYDKHLKERLTPTTTIRNRRKSVELPVTLRVE